MKRSLLFAIALFCLGNSTTHAIGHLSTNTIAGLESSQHFDSDDEKVYVHEEQIILTNQGIFLRIEDALIPLPAVFHDENGLYCRKPTIFWTCNWCGSSNPAWRNYCGSCGEHYSSSPEDEAVLDD